jgi:hypothetical protein
MYGPAGVPGGTAKAVVVKVAVGKTCRMSAVSGAVTL